MIIPIRTGMQMTAITFSSGLVDFAV